MTVDAVVVVMDASPQPVVYVLTSPQPVVYVIDGFTPATPGEYSLDFSDADNSMYLAVI